MQSLNDDMDELFRRASDEYPLNTNGADWNKVLQQLHHTNKDLPDDNHKKKIYGCCCCCLSDLYVVNMLVTVIKI